METIDERTRATTLPSLSDMFNNRQPPDDDLLKVLVENMTFSEYPGAKLGSASSLAGFLMNSNNIGDFRASGCLGAIVEILRRTNIEEDPDSEAVRNLVTSLHIICDGDLSVQRRLMNHPTGLATIVRLCKRVTGRVQVLSFDILEWLGKLEADSVQRLLDKNIIKVLLKPAFMYRPSTLLATRRRAAQMVRALINVAPERMRIYDFAEICVDEHGRRRIDGDMEQWLLSATLNHLHWREKHQRGHLPSVFTLLRHLINEVLLEAFDSIEHMQMIMRCCLLVSKDPQHIRFMLDNKLGPALQYLVRTDFNLFRPKSKKTVDSAASERDKLRKIASQVKTKRLSILDTGERPASTLMFLSLVKPVQKATAKHDDVNFTVTKLVCNLFENIIDFDTIVISDLVGSGLVPALLFRVGKGRDRDLRFNKVVVHFHHHLLLKVTLAQPHRGHHMSQYKTESMSGVEAKKSFYWPRGQGPPPCELSAPHLFSIPEGGSNAAADDAQSIVTELDMEMEGDDDSQERSLSAAHARKMKMQSTDLLVVSNTLFAHGVADILFATLHNPQLEEPAVVREAIVTLAMMRYSVFNDTAVQSENIDALFLIYRTRADCFYQFLFILCEMVQCFDARTEVLEELVSKHKALRVLVRALQMSGWVFHDKDMVYRCFGRLAVLPHFAQSLREVHGTAVLCRDVQMRKKNMRIARRLGAGDGDGTEQLLPVLREDLACIRIQAMARRRQGYRRVCVLKGLTDPGAKNRKPVGKTKPVAKRGGGAKRK